LDDVVKGVLRWRDVEPFYPDQVNGLAKTSESRGMEAVLNARWRHATALRADQATRRMAFGNMWALQFRGGKRAGSWA
jgi:squalene-hopene/tetraprenyl-beta-curcumene cyclase